MPDMADVALSPDSNRLSPQPYASPADDSLGSDEDEEPGMQSAGSQEKLSQDDFLADEDADEAEVWASLSATWL